ncbi:MAG TPA: prolyl oligopeptidase family serine peptidase [Candidatus Dormibacteraeota bacterium]|nr:prolyl oligopeptidase family serine peptidase [Candidatus Dormibacteraeota bacterium]
MSSNVSTQRRVSPYGSWRSPVSADAIVAGAIGLSQIQLDGDDVYWVEQRPAEAGRNVIVRRLPDGRIEDVTPPAFNARTRVHEYGGGAYLVDRGTIWFTNFKDQRLYRQNLGRDPVPVTPERDIRHADMILDRRRERLISVCEDHSTSSTRPVNTIVSFDAAPGATGPRKGKEVLTLVEGNDFYAAPRVNPRGTHLCWLTWNHPNMPWDGSELWVGELTVEGTIRAPRKVAGGDNESIFQPTWSGEGDLYFVSDRTNWWNLYRWRRGAIEPVVEMPAELGTPYWLFGMATYAFESPRRVVCQIRSKGLSRLAVVDPETREVKALDTPYTAMHPFIQAYSGRAYTIAGSPTEPMALIAVDLDTSMVEVIRRSTTVDIRPTYLSMPEAIEFPTGGGRTAHAWYYPPLNPAYEAPQGELPPLIVYVHGGPTGSVSNVLDLSEQFWTTRGFGYLVVNYGGSTGYGRDYRERLNGQWGVVDVDDSINAARYLIDRGRADGNRVAITGGSAGGYTVLRAMTSTHFFKAGASHFGISDLESFHPQTHKFESMYDQRLIGRWPEDRQIYRERSAINSVDRINAPIILFQGLEDKIVPPNQAEVIVAAMRKKRLPVAYIAFEGEQHGFRIAKNIKRTLEGELYFYSKIFGFELADSVEPVKIENLNEVDEA